VTLPPDALRDLLEHVTTIAVVGLSPDPGRPSNEVASYLRDAGYRIIPVNPHHESILGEPCYPTLMAAAQEHTIDVVDIFRRSESAGAIVDEAITVRPRLIWLQVGVVDAAACARANARGIPCVMDRCLKVEHRHLEVRSGGR
jgi:hypothetical protein